MLLALVPLIKSDEGNKCGQRPGSDAFFLHGLIPDKINPNGFALDIFIIFLVSGIINLAYKWKHKTVTPRIIKLVIVTMVAAALISIVAAVIIIKWLQ